jgi:hypothetical protein
MEAKKIEEKSRRFSRFSTNMKAQYLLELDKDWKECTIVNISREGMGITFQTREKIVVGSPIHLRLLMPNESAPINIKGMIKWVDKSGDESIGGIEWHMINRGEIIK